MRHCKSPSVFPLFGPLLLVCTLILSYLSCVRGGECRGSEGCPQDTLCRGGFCLAPEALRKSGEICQVGLQCLSHMCISGTCQPRQEPFEAPSYPEGGTDGQETNETPSQEARVEGGVPKCADFLCPVWLKSAGGFSDDTSQALHWAGKAQVLLLADFQGTAKFGEATFTAPKQDHLLIRLSENGTWAQFAHFHGAWTSTRVDGQVFTRGVVTNSKEAPMIFGFFSGSFQLSNFSKTASGKKQDKADGFLTKLQPHPQSSSGYIVDKWFQLKGLGQQFIQDVVFAQEGSLYGIGHYRGATSLEEKVVKPTNSSGHSHLLFFKIASNDTLVSTHSYGQGGDVYASRIVVDDQGAVYIAGTYQGAPTLGQHKLPDTKDKKAFLLKLEKEKIIWVKTFAGDYQLGHLSRLLVEEGRLYFALAFSGYVQYETKGNLRSTSEQKMGILLSLETKQPKVLWAQKIPMRDGFSMLFHGKLLWLAGGATQAFRLGSFSLQPKHEGKSFGYVASLNTEGVWQKVKPLYSQGELVVSGLSSDQSKHLYLSGHFTQQIYWPHRENGSDFRNLKSKGGKDIFIMKVVIHP